MIEVAQWRDWGADAPLTAFEVAQRAQQRQLEIRMAYEASERHIREQLAAPKQRTLQDNDEEKTLTFRRVSPFATEIENAARPRAVWIEAQQVSQQEQLNRQPIKFRRELPLAALQLLDIAADATLKLPPETTVKDCLPTGDIQPPPPPVKKEPAPTFHNKPRVFTKDVWKDRGNDSMGFRTAACGVAWTGRDGK